MRSFPVVGLLLLLAMLLVLVVISASPDLFLMTTSLTASEGEAAQRGNDVRASVIHFADESGNEVARVSVDVEPVMEGLDRVTVQFPHGTETPLRTLQLRWHGQTADLPVSLIAPPGHPWPPFTFQQVPGGEGSLFAVGDLGVQGRGTVTFEFLLGPRPATVPAPEPLDLAISFTLYRTRFSMFRVYRGDTSLPVVVPLSQREE